MLGVHAVSGRGEVFKSGGRVVKNVTGYDLSKGLAGSWGTLAVLTEVTFKVLPRAETSLTLAVSGLDDRAGVDVLCAAMGCTGEISGAAHVPAETVRALPISYLSESGASWTFLRLEGFGPSVLYRAGRVAELFAHAGEIIRIEHEDCVRLWTALRDVEPFAATGRAVWKVSVAPAAGPTVVAALRGQAEFRHFYDWSGGLVWIEISDALPDALAGAIRTAIKNVGGGHATLIRAEGTPPDVPRFQPQPEAHAALSRRLKESFDPMNVLNPGRMVGA